MGLASPMLRRQAEKAIIDMKALSEYIGRHVTVWHVTVGSIGDRSSLLPFSGRLASVDDYQGVKIIWTGGEKEFKFVGRDHAVVSVTSMAGDSVYHNPTIDPWRYDLKSDSEIARLRHESGLVPYAERRSAGMLPHLRGM